MKIAYITAHAPFGRGETFVLEEMIAVDEQGVELVIVPRNPPKEVFHDLARQLLDRAIWLPLFDWRIFLAFLKTVALKPRLWWIIGRILRHSRTLKILVKNLAVAPKAVFIAGLLHQTRVEHIHAHWGSTTATMAWIVSELTGIPWSVTLHRWDIAEKNLLKLKVERAAFVRCISGDGRREVLRIVGETYQDKVKVLHMGVRLPETLLPQFRSSRPNFVIACPANLVPVKGHRFLIECCAVLLKKGIKSFRCLLIGDGPLEAEIRQQVAKFGLGEVVKLVGRLPHGDLMQMYKKGEVDAVVLPSIVTSDGEREGIPIALMEAMAYRIPVVATSTGGIPELLSGGNGIIVSDKNVQQLADAIERLVKDENLAKDIGERGRRKVNEEFNICKNVNVLLKMIKGA
ncbi:MAG: glycosyltransferase [Firmicutes bacterium]|nr:glycosyltransferase [Bacillota bacterium]